MRGPKGSWVPGLCLRQPRLAMNMPAQIYSGSACFHYSSTFITESRAGETPQYAGARLGRVGRGRGAPE
jgi:hypothetical protein